MTNEQEHEAFEAWHRQDLLDMPVHQDPKERQLRTWQARAALAAKVPADPCFVLWEAMQKAGKVGNCTDDKLIVKFLREAGYCIAATPAPAPEADTTAQAEPVGFYVYEWVNMSDNGTHRSLCIGDGPNGRRPDKVYAVPYQPNADALNVAVERERVWLKRGKQSFALAYEAETDDERQWYAGQLRGALSGFTPDVKTAPAQAQQAADWMKPTTYRERFAEAVALLCGEPAPDDMIDGWLDREADDHRLQDFAADRGPAWAQGIVLLDAAHVMADTPTEGVEHGERAKPEAQQPIGQLFQHGETGRTRVVMQGDVADCDARWSKVGDLVLAKPELLTNGMTMAQFALSELYEFQQATGCDTADEYFAEKAKLEASNG